MNMPNAFLFIARSTKKKIIEYENKIVIALLFLFFAFFCYLGTLPKHGDFWSIITPGAIFASGVNDLSQYLLTNGGTINFFGNPLLGILFGVWIKIGSLFLSFDLNAMIISVQPKILQYWCIIPFLLMLLFFVVISYITVKNKWLTFICFGTFSFISIIIMGQVDIWSTFWIYLAIVLALKAFETEDNLKYIFASTLALGLSMEFKPFGGLLIPVFLIFFWILLQKKSYAQFIKYGLLCLVTLEFIVISFWSWLVWPQFQSGLTNGESTFLFNLQLAPVQLPPYHIISIWLLGYVVILYDLWSKSQSNNKIQLSKSFMFYIFAAIAWLFVSAYANPQWWLLLVPPLLLVLDNFEYKFNHVFYVTISVLFLFYTLQWTNNIDVILKFYMPIIRVAGLFSIVVFSLISAILLIWIFGLRKSLFSKVNEDNISLNNNGVTRKIAPILPACLIVFLFVVVLFVPPSIQGISQPVGEQPVGEITGGITVGQTFYSTLPNLNSISVDLATWARTDTKDVTFHLRESPESVNDIASVTVNAREIQDNSYYNFKFPKISDSANKTYYFFIDSPDSIPGNAITIWASKEDVYPQGSEYIDSKPVNGDLAFKAYYQSSPLLYI